ncbi:MAG: hypothetical protein K2M48_02730, partial [Clostridiales bacterium]|nr:hypothetical protein [Clostridiales bacterium]
MGLRQRNGFDGVNPAREDLNLTKYDEKFVYPTEPTGGDGYRAVPASEPLFSAAGGMQRPVQTPAPDPTEHSYVFGRHEPTDARASVF